MEMSRQPMKSSLMHVQVRYVFISECIVCVCARVFLGKFLSEWLMHLNYTPVWSNSLPKELKICKESTEVKNTIWFPSPEGRSSISLSLNIRGLKPWQCSQLPDAGRVQMQAEFFCERRFHCCWVKAPILPDAASFLKAAKRRVVYRLLAFSLCMCPVNELASCLICIKMDFLPVHSPLGITRNLGFPEVRDWCFGVYTAYLDSAQHFASSDDPIVGPEELRNREKGSS